MAMHERRRAETLPILTFYRWYPSGMFPSESMKIGYLSTNDQGE